jgi:hypothetical protein
MQRFLSKLSVLIVLGLSIAFAQKPQVILGPGLSAAAMTPYHQTSNLTLTNDKTYVLTGWYFVDSTYTLTIEKGTTVLCDKNTVATLVISRGAKIFAEGTKEQPIVFTSSQAAGSRVTGDWGGIILLGNAPTNKPTSQQIEGGFGTSALNTAMYGGPDSLDNSGTLKYMRIEYPGYPFAQDNEINGLTCGGVGKGTTFEYIMVSYSNDDDIENFGGYAQFKHIVTVGQVDDTFDTDFGYAGRAQFYLSVRDPQAYDASASGSSNGFESDNEGTAPFSATPRTKVKVSNFTYIGPYSQSGQSWHSHWGNLAMLRRATELSIYNSIIAGWAKPLMIRDSLTMAAAIDNRLEIRNTTLITNGSKYIDTSSSPTSTMAVNFDAKSWFDNAAKGNVGHTSAYGADYGLPLAAWAIDTTNNAVPTSGSELATAGADFTSGRLAGDSWFTPVTYRGAFDPAVPVTQQWTAGWTNFAPQNYNPEKNDTKVTMKTGWNLVSMPSSVTDSTASTLFPGAVSGTIYSYSNSGYTNPAKLTRGQGYWAFYSSPVSNKISGYGINDATITAAGAGWVLVGSVTSSVPASALTSNPSDAIVSGTLYSWNGTSYENPTTLVPGQGYWVFVNKACTLTVSSGF